MDLLTESLVHQNNHYQVVYIPELSRQVSKGEKGLDVLGNYEVRSRIYDTVEFISDSLPLALSMSEHWDRILTRKTYLEDPFAELNEALQEPFRFDKKDGGGLQ